MINLIKNELTKVFKKKSIIVMLCIMLGYVILTNFIYAKMFNNDGNMDLSAFTTENVSFYEKEIDNLNLKNPDDLNDYIYYRTEIDTLNLINKYEKNSWQSTIIRNNMYDTIYNINYFKYSHDKSDSEVKKYQDIYNKQIEKLNKDDWKAFVKEEIDNEQNNITKLKQELNQEQNKKKQTELQSQIKTSELNLEKLNQRLDKNISYSNNYLNTALENYYNFKNESITFDEDNAKYEDKLQYNRALTEMAKSKYTIDNNQNVNKINDTRGIFLNFFNEYEILILIIIVMIGGSIVSDEFSKGTVKLLLIRPHSRSKILTSKFITTLLTILMAFIVLGIMQLIVGGIFFGFSSLNIPAVIYNFSTNSVQTYNIFTYLLINLVANLPKYILITTLAFAIGTIFKNTALATTLGILGYIGSSVINVLVIQNNINIFKYFVTLNWEFKEYLFGGLPSFSAVSLPFSIVICIIYLLVMLIPTYIIFKKTNIKND